VKHNITFQRGTLGSHRLCHSDPAVAGEESQISFWFKPALPLEEMVRDGSQSLS